MSSSHDIARYSRQLLLESFGPASQTSLSASTALVVGAGGLGCPAALYLAGAGVGRIILVDNGDCVELSNLHRQIGHSTARVGTEKTTSLALAISALNPDVTVEAIGNDGGLRPANAQKLVRCADVVLDCTDNVISRYLVNDACVLENKPLVSGSAIGMEGQLSVYGRGPGNPCYRCVFPAPPPLQCVGRCDTAGVLGPVPGVIGTLQALEAIKILSEFKWSKPLVGRMLLFDGAEARFRDVKMRRSNPQCTVCGRPPQGRVLSTADFDYDRFVNGESGTVLLEENQRLQPADFKVAVDAGNYTLVDVRSRDQFDLCRLPGAINIPANELMARMGEVQAQDIVLVVCRRGNESQEAVRQLKDAGIDAKDLVGGLDAWRKHCDPSFPLY